jgi:Cft2 family RNA processing exonuclease
VSLLEFRYSKGGLHLPQLGLWLDPHHRRLRPDCVFVSHAHSDHTARHEEVILSAPTARLMQARLGGSRSEMLLDYGKPRQFSHAGNKFQLTLLPAGHIFGSAMVLIEADGESLLYTGDFQLRPSLAAEQCEPRHADVLIMETTFGRPRYVFPPAAETMQEVVRFCMETLGRGETAMLLGYSLGKSQELLKGLNGAGLPLMLHSSIEKMTHIYKEFGHSFPGYASLDPASARGKVILCPPNARTPALLRSLGTVRAAVVTGWALDRGCRYQYKCDAAFPLSDHADFPGLIEFVQRVQPAKVFTLHGFAADFAQALRRLRYDAWALSEDDQLLLELD